VRISTFFIIGTFTGLLLFSCKKLTTKKIKEGEIQYSITYLESDLNNIPTDLLPKKMILKFKGNKTFTEIDGFFGFFNISNVTDYSKSINWTYLKVYGYKYLFDGKRGEIAAGFGGMADIKIEYTDNVKKIQGYECRQANIHLPNSNEGTLEVFYTMEFGPKHPNSSNPYKEINGIMLEFYLTLSKLKMKMVAENIIEKPIPDKFFKRQNDYKSIRKSQMEILLDKLMEE
jgi:hypothetical protein